MIKKIVLWYLRNISLEYCAKSNLCSDCIFGCENCECTILKMESALRKIK